MIKKIKLLILLFFLFNFSYTHSYEIIRDPIFENYFIKFSNELDLKKIDTYLVKNNNANAFVLNNNIYFTTSLLKLIKNEDTLKAIFLHEYAHVINNHFQTKKIKIKQTNSNSNILNLFAVGLAVITGSSNIGLGTSITLNNNLVNDISKHSINFEIEADNFMINQIKENNINTSELITFLYEMENVNISYFKTHPSSIEIINNLKFIKNSIKNNSYEFDWIKAKYSKDSKNKLFNQFFINLEKGIYNKNEKLIGINYNLAQYEAYKNGFIIDDWSDNFKSIMLSNDNSFLKIEYINYLLDNDIIENYNFIEEIKYNRDIVKEYFYSYIYGKYYNKIENSNLSNFYFCQFYQLINELNKADFFCKKYDIKDIPVLDKSHALFK